MHVVRIRDSFNTTTELIRMISGVGIVCLAGIRGIVGLNRTAADLAVYFLRRNPIFMGCDECCAGIQLERRCSVVLSFDNIGPYIQG